MNHNDLRPLSYLTTNITFHYVSRGDLPAAGDLNVKAVITETKSGRVSWNRAYYDGQFWHGSGSMSNVIAWADMDDVCSTVLFYLSTQKEKKP